MNDAGITSKIDEKLKLSQAVEKATSKVGELKSSVTNKVRDAAICAHRSISSSSRAQHPPPPPPPHPTR